MVRKRCCHCLGKKKRALREIVCDLFGRKVSTVIDDFLTHRHADITSAERDLEAATYRHVVYNVQLLKVIHSMSPFPRFI